MSEPIKPQSFVARVIKGTLFLGIGTVVVSVANFIFKYIIIHNLPPSDFGIYTLIVTIIGILGFFTEFNLNSTATIFMSRDIENRDNRIILSEILLIFTVLSLACLALTFILTRFPFTTSVFVTLRDYFWWIWLLVLMTGLMNIGFGILRAYKKMNYEALVNAIKAVFTIALAVILIYVFAQRRLNTIITILIATQIIVLVAIMAFFQKLRKSIVRPFIRLLLGREEMKISFPRIRNLFSFSFYISTITILMTLIISIDRMLIPGRLSTAALGIYSSGFIIITIPKIITNAVSTALVPYISEGSADRSRTRREFLGFFRLFSLIAGVGYGLFILVLAPLSRLFLPKAYLDVKSILWILLIGSFFSDIAGLNASFIASAGKTYELRNLSVILILTLAVNIVLNLVLIPVHGITGAAFANLFSFGFAGLITTFQVWNFPER